MALKGCIPWNKGKKTCITPWNKGTKGVCKANSGSLKKGVIFNEQWHEKQKARTGDKSPRFGKKHTEKSKELNRQKHLGKTHSDETKSKFRKRLGELAGGWKGGLTKKSKLVKSSFEYKMWRMTVFERDNYICQKCGGKNQIEAHHIKPQSIFPELRLALDNGQTLCHKCHKLTDTYGNKIKKK